MWIFQIFTLNIKFLEFCQVYWWFQTNWSKFIIKYVIVVIHQISKVVRNIYRRIILHGLQCIANSCSIRKKQKKSWVLQCSKSCAHWIGFVWDSWLFFFFVCSHFQNPFLSGAFSHFWTWIILLCYCRKDKKDCYRLLHPILEIQI